MFVGHAALAFALVGRASSLVGIDDERAVALAVTAGAFATVPDVDILYALSGVLQVGLVGLWTTVDAFWSTGNVVHRAVTHSLVLGVPASVGFALATTRRGRPAALALFGAVVAWVLAVDGGLAGVVAVASLGAGAAVAVLAARQFDLPPLAVLGVAAAGWLTHPFGDVFTGEPPAMLYPLDFSVVVTRVTLHPDPTLHLLAAFGIELATIWLAVLVFLRLRGHRFTQFLDRRATLGVGYAAAAAVLPAPTLSVSFPFVFTVLGVGAIGLLAGRRPWSCPDDRLPATVTGLAAVSIAATAYTATYLAL